MPKYHMRRKDLLITDDQEINRIISAGKYITLALCKDNEPYIATLSYGYDESEKVIYMHCAQKGVKLDFIRTNPQVCATIIEDKGYLDGMCDHSYQSLVINGTITELKEANEIKSALITMVNQLESNPKPRIERINGMGEAVTRLTLLKLTITEITGRHSRK